jgi:hypothetical protein
MKRLLLILLCVPLIGLGQNVNIPDANFEQALINLGYDTGTPNGSIPTANIDTLTFLDISFQNISDLTGIEDFTSLTYLEVSGNPLGNIDISNNIYLTHLFCRDNDLSEIDLSQSIYLYEVNLRLNNLTSLDVSNNLNLGFLAFDENQLTTIDLSNNINLGALGAQSNLLSSLDVSNNYGLWQLYCWDNNITSLDLRNNNWLNYLNCENNKLTDLDIRNGSNNQISEFQVLDNFGLYCINVDDSSWSDNNWTIDLWQYFSENCSSTTSIQEHTSNKKIQKVTDVLGREVNEKRNTPLFYIYNDGTVERKIIIE